MFLDDGDIRLYHGDALETVRQLPDESVDCVVTSPPYWGLRDYGTPGQMGLEPTPDLFVTGMVELFREIRRVLAPHGTCWVNLGDAFLDKQLVGAPWRVAFALQQDGWWLRSDIIWAKPNLMPESVTDRPTKAHEYVFLLTKQPRYWFDAEAVREPATQEGIERESRSRLTAYDAPGQTAQRREPSNGTWTSTGRNVRSVWQIATQPYPEAHFATFPEELARRCILAGCPVEVCVDCGRPRQRVDSPHESRTVSGMRRDVREDAPQNDLLLEDVREPTNGPRAPEQQGLRDVDEGLQAVASTRASDGEPRGLRDGAPPSDGGTSWSPADAVRGGASHQWGEGGQPSGEPAPYGEGPSRQDAQAQTEGDPVSPLRRTSDATATCSETCSGRSRPGVVLDPFVGSGTTCKVARDHQRHTIGIDLNREYLELAARRLQQLSLLNQGGHE